MIALEKWAEQAGAWTPRKGVHRVLAVDAHTAGEPLRVLLTGVPLLEGATLAERRLDAEGRLEALRRGLMWEPRGHTDMYGCVVTPAVSAEADFGVVFMHNAGFSTMCGHGVIAVATVTAELGLLEDGAASSSERRLGMDTPAGFVSARVVMKDGHADAVSFRNVPSFAVVLGGTVEVPGLGRIAYDLAFGGAFYAYVRAEEAGVTLDPSHYRRIIELGRTIKDSVAARGEAKHPGRPDLSFLYGTIFVGPPRSGADFRHVCVFADGEVDRSPTGTGVSGWLALRHAREEAAVGAQIQVESILGTRFGGRIMETSRVGDLDAVVPEITGSAFITGRHEFFFDPRDPLREGFILR